MAKSCLAAKLGSGTRHCSIEQYRDIVGIKVSDCQVQLAVPVHIAHRDEYRTCARGELLVDGKAGRVATGRGGVEQYRHGVENKVRDGEISLPSPLRSPIATNVGPSPVAKS